MQVYAPRFEISECNSEAEREFIEALHARAEAADWHADGWPREDRVVVSIDLSDGEFGCSLRTLRVDFDGSMLLAGPDETHQLVTALDAGSKGVMSMRDAPVQVLAGAAADWLEREMARPIERCEWNRPEFHRRLWRFADTGEELVVSDSQNQRRHGLGPPDRIVRVK